MGVSDYAIERIAQEIFGHLAGSESDDYRRMLIRLVDAFDMTPGDMRKVAEYLTEQADNAE